jgi:hypothetical protein
MSSYILGTITVLVVRADERTKEYRQAMGDLEEYAAQNKVPSVSVALDCSSVQLSHSLKQSSL